MVKDFKQLEQEIVNLRVQLRNLSQKRFYAETSGNKRETFDARIKLADSALRNCSTVTEYIRRVSETIANEIDEKNGVVAQSLNVVKKTRSLGALRSWYTEELAPFWNKVEQEWYIISEMRKKEKIHPAGEQAILK
jgi:ribosomal protein L29